jgi:cobalt-zinc-cadmium efflux system protein
MHFHSHAAHAGHSAGAKMTFTLGFAVFFTLALVVVEVASGYLGHSIALVSDAVHNLTDVPSLVISWLAARWALRPATPEKTYGYHRAGILAAFVNAIVLALAALFLIYESIGRLRQPAQVHAAVMLWVSVIALVVNGGITIAVHGERHDLNVRSVWIHNLGDALSNIAIFVAALWIRFTGAYWTDAVIGMLIGGTVLWSGTGILNESGHILLEGMPRGMKLADVAAALLRIEGVREVHDIHIWTLGTDLQALSCHVRIPDMHLEDCERILGQVREVLAHDFGITHITVQVERAGLPAEAGLFMPEPARRAK